MTRFCPYCGKQLSERSRFCPKCGKAAPQRRRTTGGVVVGEARGEAQGAALRPELKGRDGVATKAGPRAIRIAPPTYSLVGAFEQAGFGLRYGALMFDFLITLIAMMSFTFAVTAVSRESVVGSNRELIIVALLTVLLFVLNFVVLAGRNGQSAGMRILGIRIVRVDGTPFTTKHATIRHLLGYPLSTAFFFLGFLWMLWDPKQQGWHDKIARTLVVMSR